MSGSVLNVTAAAGNGSLAQQSTNARAFNTSVTALVLGHPYRSTNASRLGDARAAVSEKLAYLDGDHNGPRARPPGRERQPKKLSRIPATPASSMKAGLPKSVKERLQARTAADQASAARAVDLRNASKAAPSAPSAAKGSPAKLATQQQQMPAVNGVVRRNVPSDVPPAIATPSPCVRQVAEARERAELACGPGGGFDSCFLETRTMLDVIAGCRPTAPRAPIPTPVATSPPSTPSGTTLPCAEEAAAAWKAANEVCADKPPPAAECMIARGKALGSDVACAAASTRSTTVTSTESPSTATPTSGATEKPNPSTQDNNANSSGSWGSKETMTAGFGFLAVGGLAAAAALAKVVVHQRRRGDGGGGALEMVELHEVVVQGPGAAGEQAQPAAPAPVNVGQVDAAPVDAGQVDAAPANAAPANADPVDAGQVDAQVDAASIRAVTEGFCRTPMGGGRWPGPILDSNI